MVIEKEGWVGLKGGGEGMTEYLRVPCTLAHNIL